jgi:hypothetical protein
MNKRDELFARLDQLAEQLPPDDSEQLTGRLLVLLAADMNKTARAIGRLTRWIAILTTVMVVFTALLVTEAGMRFFEVVTEAQ